MSDQITVKVNFSKYGLEVIRYVAYELSDKFWVLIEKGKKKNEINVILEPINSKLNVKNLKKVFYDKLNEEKLRSEIYDKNIKLREHLIKQAILYQPSNNESDSFLTPEEEKELEKLIKEVEMELKEELNETGELNEIKKSWEEKNRKKRK